MVNPSCHCARLFPNHYCIDLQLEYYPRWKTPSTPRPRPNRSRPIISSLLLQCAHATRTEDVACRVGDEVGAHSLMAVKHNWCNCSRWWRSRWRWRSSLNFLCEPIDNYV